MFKFYRWYHFLAFYYLLLLHFLLLSRYFLPILNFFVSSVLNHFQANLYIFYIHSHLLLTNSSSKNTSHISANFFRKNNQILKCQLLWCISRKHLQKNSFIWCGFADRAETHDFWSQFLLFILIFFFGFEISVMGLDLGHPKLHIYK